MQKIELFFIIKDWIVGGVKTFEKDLISYFSKQNDVNIHILFMPDFFYKYSVDEIGMPKEFYKYVKTFDISMGDSWAKRVDKIKKYILSFDNNITIANCYYEFFQLSYDNRINFVSILHSDQEIYYVYTNKYRNFLSGIVSVSKLIQKRLKDIYQLESSYIPYGVDTKQFNKRVVFEEKEELNIVYCGRIEQEQKRVLDLIDLVKKLESSKIRYKFHIIGDGNYLNILKANIKSKNVVFYGRLYKDEIVKVFKYMDIIVLVSEYEGLPLVLLEAMNMGIVPVITNFKSGIDDVLNRFNSRVSPIGNMQKMRDNIKFYYENPKILYKHKKRAQKISKRFSIEKMAQRYKKLFKKIVSKQKDVKIKKIDEYIREYKQSERLGSLDDFIQREILILKNVKNIAIYGYGKSGKMVLEFMKSLKKEPKIIIDDNLSHPLSVCYNEFLKRKDEVDLIVMGKYQNIYHDIYSLDKVVLKLESVKYLIDNKRGF